MLVECTTEDFSDPEAVSGSSTRFDRDRPLEVVFCCVSLSGCEWRIAFWARMMEIDLCLPVKKVK